MMSIQTEDSSTIEENDYNIDFVIDVITKEAPKEKRLTKQVLYTLFSAKSNDPVAFYQNDYENPMLAPFSLEYLITRLTANFYRK